eukprot:TRINITY_DN7891_c0_g1_i1.p1 TRINITY_DN7891_c0_g1~~TRINITY_DN7891_c0_g1_i1.p1  ORF type:complete len:286 (-),score=90.69 TRINITY_DN7891_c0_g1_i1:114-971(-)
MMLGVAMLAMRKDDGIIDTVYSNEVLNVLEIKEGAIRGKSIEYIQQHPELLEILNSFIFNLLLREPRDVAAFARTYFDSFDLRASYFKPLVISGPSAVGKGTLIRMLLKEFPDAFELSVSYTTRDPRPGEVHGKDYYFIKISQFNDMVRQNMFVEHCVVHGNLYGTAKSEITRITKDHRICIIEIDVEGAKKVQSSGVEANFMFVNPPSMRTLMDRILKRGTETRAAVEIRMENAKGEVSFANSSMLYRYKLVNDVLEKSYKEFKEMIMEIYKGAIKEIQEKAKH